MSKINIYIEETDETFELNIEGKVLDIKISTTEGTYSIVKHQENKNTSKEELDDIANALENLFN